MKIQLTFNYKIACEWWYSWLSTTRQHVNEDTVDFQLQDSMWMKIQLTFNYKTASLEIKITVDYQLTRHLSQGCYESILAIINAKITQYHISHLCIKHSLKFTSGFEVLVCSSLWVVRHYLVNQDIVHYGIKIVLVTQFMVFFLPRLRSRF